MPLLQTLSRYSFQLEYNLISLTPLQSPPHYDISMPSMPQCITLLLLFETAPLLSLTSRPRSLHTLTSAHIMAPAWNTLPVPCLTLLTPTWLQLRCHSHWEAFTISSKLGEASFCSITLHFSNQSIYHPLLKCASPVNQLYSNNNNKKGRELMESRAKRNCSCWVIMWST